MVTQRSPVRGLCSNVTLLIEKVEVGTFAVQIEIGDLRGEKFEDVEALVGAGATTTVVPGSTLRRLGIIPTRRETFEYAGGGRQVELDMAEAKARVAGRETTTWVIFGEEGTTALLGAYTLEGVLLGVDPYAQEAHPCAGTGQVAPLARTKSTLWQRQYTPESICRRSWRNLASAGTAWPRP